MTNRQEMQECVQQCQRCHSICLETVSHLVEGGGTRPAAEPVSLLLDCVDVCRTCTDFMLRGSERHPLMCGVCAEICRQCGDACARYGEDAEMRRCVEACRACADSCRRMAGGAGMARAA